MSAAQGPQLPSPPSPTAQTFVLLLPPLLGALVAFAFLPRPTAVDEARASVDRSELGDILGRGGSDDPSALGAILGESLKLTGVVPPAAPLARGAELTLETRWEVLKPLDRKWQMFVHIDLVGGRHRIHGDHWPTGDRYPTTLWQQGETVTDAWKHRVPLDAPSGSYEIFAGFYIDDERMRFTGGPARLHAGENRLRVGTLEVE